MLSTLNFKTYGARLKEIRKTAKLTQKEVSNLTNINEDTLRRIENGLVIPKYETIEILSYHYKIDLLKILLENKTNDSISHLYKVFDNIVISNPQNNESLIMQLQSEVNNFCAEKVVNPSELNLLKTFVSIYASFNSYCSHSDCLKYIDALETALKNTIPDFNLKYFEKFLYNELEVRILLFVSILYRKIKEAPKAIELLKYCLNYLELTLSNDLISNIKLKIKLYYNLSYAYYTIKDYENSIYFSSKGADLAYSSKTYYCLELILARKGISEFYLNLPEYKNTFKKLFHMLYAFDQKDQIHYFVNITRNKHGMDLSPLLQMFE